MTTPPAPLRLGIIGARSGISVRSLEPQFAASDRVDVVARASRDDDGSDAPYAELLARPDVDLVYIPLPNGMHVDWVLRSLEAGKHVLCEKPLGMDATQVTAMYDAARAADRVLIEAYASPFHPANQLVQDLVTGGALGELRFAHHTFSFPHPNPDDHRFDPVLGNGSLLDLGCYTVGPLLWLAGCEPDRVAAAAHRSDRGVEVSLSGWLDFGTFRASIETSFELPHRRDQELAGTTGVLRRPRAWFPAEDDTTISIVRPDDSVDTYTCAGGNAYRGMVDHAGDVIQRGVTPLHGEPESLRLARTLDRLAAASAP